MKHSIRTLAALVGLSLMISLFPFSRCFAASAATPLLEEGFDLSTETFGPLRLGMTAGELTEILGEGRQDGEPALWAADGLEHWQIIYDQLHITAGIARTPGEKETAAVYSLLALGPQEWKTARGAGIGDTVTVFEGLYADAIDPLWDMTTHHSLLIGSLFGGILAGVEDGLVVSLYFGAMAE
ncbi:MAG: hypothetical protein AB9880_04660 [Christensenellales bacterium]